MSYNIDNFWSWPDLICAKFRKVYFFNTYKLKRKFRPDPLAALIWLRATCALAQIHLPP